MKQSRDVAATNLRRSVAAHRRSLTIAFKIAAALLALAAAVQGVGRPQEPPYPGLTCYTARLVGPSMAPNDWVVQVKQVGELGKVQLAYSFTWSASSTPMSEITTKLDDPENIVMHISDNSDCSTVNFFIHNQHILMTEWLAHSSAGLNMDSVTKDVRFKQGVFTSLEGKTFFVAVENSIGDDLLGEFSIVACGILQLDETPCNF